MAMPVQVWPLRTPPAPLSNNARLPSTCTLPRQLGGVRYASDKPREQLRDEGIRAPLIRLVDPTTNQLAGPYKPADILSKIDRREYVLQQVAAGAANTDQGSWTLDQLPVCKLISKREEYQRQREGKRRAQANADSKPAPPKDLQLTWSVSEHDLTHKLAKARKELERGHKVRVVVISKKGTRRALPGSDEEARRIDLIKQLEHELCKPAEGEKDTARVVRGPEWRNQMSMVEVYLEPLL